MKGYVKSGFIKMDGIIKSKYKRIDGTTSEYIKYKKIMMNIERYKKIIFNRIIMDMIK
jgi:hypothetical protein